MQFPSTAYLYYFACGNLPQSKKFVGCIGYYLHIPINSMLFKDTDSNQGGPFLEIASILEMESGLHKPTHGCK